MNSMTLNRVVITISILVAAFLFGCSESKPLDLEHEHDHENVRGLILLVDEEEIHHQLEGEQEGVVQVMEGETLEVEVVLLNEDGEPLDSDHDPHEGDHDHGHDHAHDHGLMESQQEEEEHHEHGLVFTGYNPMIITIHTHEHENGEGHHEGEEDEEHEGLGFELTGIEHGQTAFTLWLLEEELTVYTSLPILTHVEE
jgi:hypothetical protein